MPLDEVEKQKILATKSPSFTMKALRPIANLLARYTSPSQVCSVLKEFGLIEDAKTPVDVETVLLKVFENFRAQNDDATITKIIERLLGLYAQLVDEQLHEKGLVGQVRKILDVAHFQLAFHIKKKEYVILPMEGPVHGIVMRAEGTNEKDFHDPEQKKLRTLLSPHLDPTNFYITKEQDDFKYKGAVLVVGKDTEYFKVFSALYAIVPTGGTASYKALGDEVIKRIPRAKHFTTAQMSKFLQDNLRDKNGFLRYAKIDNELPGGRELIHTVRGTGIEFNNRKEV